MPVESVTYISDLVPTNPIGATDPKSQGDDHLRNIKLALKNTFPNLNGAVSATDEQLSQLAVGFADGTAALPIISFAGNLNTGLYRVGANVVGVATGGVRRLQVGSFGVRNDVDGTAAAPSFHWDSDPDTGPYLVGANDIGFAAAGVRQFGISNVRVFSAVPLRVPDGTAIAPSFAFDNGTDLGVFRAGPNNLRIAAGGVSAMGFLSTHLEPFKQLQSIDGTAAAPTYSFSNDPGNGGYRAAAGVFGIAAGGVRRIQVGSFGIRSDVDGSAAAPSYHWDSDPDTGPYLAAANTIGFATGGVLRASIADTLLTLNTPVSTPNASASEAGYKGVPINDQAGAYTAVLADAGKTIRATGAGTKTIPANASVAYPIGTVLSFVNSHSAAISVAITTDTLTLAGSASTGTRTLGVNGMASALKLTATSWLISGTGLS